MLVTLAIVHKPRYYRGRWAFLTLVTNISWIVWTGRSMMSSDLLLKPVGIVNEWVLIKHLVLLFFWKFKPSEALRQRRRHHLLMAGGEPSILSACSLPQPALKRSISVSVYTSESPDLLFEPSEPSEPTSWPPNNHRSEHLLRPCWYVITHCVFPLHFQSWCRWFAR